jgi:hypothetical protein
MFLDAIVLAEVAEPLGKAARITTCGVSKTLKSRRYLYEASIVLGCSFFFGSASGCALRWGTAVRPKDMVCGYRGFLL